MRNEPRGVSVFTALAVIAIIIIGGIVSVQSSSTYSTESNTTPPRNQQVAAPVEALPNTEVTNDTIATSTESNVTEMIHAELE